MPLLDVTVNRRLRAKYADFKKSRESKKGSKILTWISNRFTFLKGKNPTNWLQRAALRLQPLFHWALVFEKSGIGVRQKLDHYDGPLLIVSNHLGIRDGSAIFATIGKVALVLTKSEQLHSHFSAWFWKSLGCIPISRGQPQSSEIRSILNTWNMNGWILVFPHGTYTYNAEVSGDPHFLTAPIKEGVLTLGYKKKIPTLVVALGIREGGVTGVEYHVHLETILDPKDFEDVDGFCKTVQNRLDTATLSLYDLSS